MDVLCDLAFVSRQEVEVAEGTGWLISLPRANYSAVTSSGDSAEVVGRLTSFCWV